MGLGALVGMLFARAYHFTLSIVSGIRNTLLPLMFPHISALPEFSELELMPVKARRKEK
jgi:hypothetical protein